MEVSVHSAFGIGEVDGQAGEVVEHQRVRAAEIVLAPKLAIVLDIDRCVGIDGDRVADEIAAVEIDRAARHVDRGDGGKRRVAAGAQRAGAGERSRIVKRRRPSKPRRTVDRPDCRQLSKCCPH